jgi:hypothetical protein
LLQLLVIDTPLSFPEQLFSLVIEQTFDFDSMGFAVFLQESHVSRHQIGMVHAKQGKRHARAVNAGKRNAGAVHDV